MSERGKNGGARNGSIGARLQTARERANLSLLQAAELLHIDPDVIQALESENFGELGAAVYVRGHMRHYAELVNESAAELLDLYAQSVHAGPPPDLTLMPHLRQSSSWRGALAMTGLAVVIGVGLIGSIRWIYMDLHPGNAAPAVAAPTAAQPANPASAPGAPATEPPATNVLTIQAADHDS